MNTGFQSWMHKRFLIVSGKGGVGKTSVSISLANALASAGKRVLWMQMRAEDWVGAEIFGQTPIGAEIVSIDDRFDAVNTNPDAALSEYGKLVLRSEVLYRLLFENRMTKAFLHATPGLDAWSMLGKAYYHALGHGPGSKGEYDHVVIDAPASGHALQVFRVPFAIQEIAPPGLLRREAARAAEMLSDGVQTALVLVTLPEMMPVTEALETRAAFADIPLPLASVVVNRKLPTELVDIFRSGVEATNPLEEKAHAFFAKRVAAETEALRYLQSRQIEPIFIEDRGSNEMSRATIRSIAHELSRS